MLWRGEKQDLDLLFPLFMCPDLGASGWHSNHRAAPPGLLVTVCKSRTHGHRHCGGGGGSGTGVFWGAWRRVCRTTAEPFPLSRPRGRHAPGA